MAVNYDNPFLKPDEEYTRTLNIIGGYVHAQASMLERMEGIPYDEARKWVISEMKPGGSNELTNPKVLYLWQKTRGNRDIFETTLLDYIKDVTVEDSALMSPTMAVYQRPEVKQALTGEFTDGNIKDRNFWKKQKFILGQRGDKQGAVYSDTMQASKKEQNNSLSGAQATSSNTLYNKSAHSTLTSTCRSATSYANASNERFLKSNRHYWSPDVVLQDLSNAELYGPHAEIKLVSMKYGVKIPTIEETLACVRKSSVKYWRNNARMDEVIEFVEHMSPEGRASFVYAGDLYQLALLNPEVIRAFYTEFMYVAYEPLGDGVDYLADVDDDTKALASLLSTKLLAGISLGDAKKDNPDIYFSVGATVKHIKDSLRKWADFIDAFLRPRYCQPSIAEFPGIVREAVLTSDTDSTIFTNMYWTHWYVGKYDFSEDSYAIGYITTYMASQVVANALALLVGNLGVGKRMLRKLAMKNEFYFPTYSLTPAAKHYFTYVSAQEGNVFKQLDTEIKGVGLRSSKAPPFVTERLHDYMRWLMDGVMKGDSWSAAEILKPAIDMETEVRRSIESGGVEFLSSEKVKHHTAYAKGEAAPNYRHHLLWKEVFAPKYGHVDEPPYQTFKVSVRLDSKRRMRNWVDSLEDRSLAERFNTFMERYGFDNTSSFQIPQIIAMQHGIPKEIIPVIDVRKGVTLIMKPFYVVIESLGLYIANERNTRLLTDSIWEAGEAEAPPTF